MPSGISTEALPAPEIFQCFEIRNPPETEERAVRVALEENPQNALTSTQALTEKTSDAADGHDGLSYLAVNIRKYWQPGRTLTIKFLSGQPTLHDKVQKYAGWWLTYANLKFEWVPMDESTADIRIDFQRGGGSSSRIGVDALVEKNQGKRTMNLDINTKHPEEYIRRKVLHEFGHVLGCEHEHQSPLASFEWNKDYIYEALSKPPNSWSRATIDHNVIKRLEASEVSASVYDPDSIMLYQYPPEWFKNSGGVGTKDNTTLSARDKEWISQKYPPWSSDIGSFSTLERRSMGTLTTEPDSKDIAFEPAYAEPPRLAVGLSWLDLECTADICVSAKAEDISEDHFTATVVPGLGSHVRSAACSWLEASASEADIQIGTWDVADAGGSTATKKSSTIIKFPTRFQGGGTPIVVAFFSGLSMGKDSAWRVKTYVTDASPFKFKLHVEAGADTDLRGATVTWVAFPADKEGMVGGTFATDDIPGPENAGVMDFKDAGFHAAPAVMMAISGLDFECGKDLRLRVSHSSLTAEGMTWQLDSWLDSKLNTATGAFVAVCPPKVSDW